MSWSATALTIALELGLTATLFIPFIEWPRLFKRVRLAHVVIGALFSYALYSPQDDFDINDSIVSGLLWVTYTVTFGLEELGLTV